ncbi:hypothetical protein BC826DRAFT_1123659 [Russula brevipes]|nr:hypothetical protein BC826DRAFT_1123659 [Russula brevipes]
MYVNSPTYESYLPQRFYRPASHYLDDEPSSAFAFDGLAYSPSFHAFPPQIDTETRYRRALHELKAAEQELGAYMALEHARQRQATLLRQHAAAEAARRERTLALQAETRRIQRIEHARLLRTQVEDRNARRQRALLGALVDADAKQVPVPQHHFLEILPTRSRPTPSPVHRDEEVLTFGELLGLLAGIRPETQPVSTPERPTLRTPSEFHRLAEPQSQPPKHNGTPVASKEFLELFHGIASQSRAAGGYQPIHQPNAAPKPETIPLNEKAKGKAKAESVPLPTLLQALFSERMRSAPDQEMRDVEQAIKLSTQGHGVVDARKGRASKVAGSSPSASKVKIDGSSSLGRAATAPRGPASASIPSPAPQPVSPLTMIRTVRSQASALQSAFKFPPVLDFDHSDFAISANNAPVRAYEYALNGLLEQLDAIESDGNEEIRDARREVVREVEKALEDVERKVKERAPRATIEVTKEELKGYDVESEEPEAAPATQDIPPADVAPIADAKPVLPDVVSAAPPVDADVIQAISEEYWSASPASGSEVAVAELRNVAPSDAVSSALEHANSEAVLAFDDFSDSTATIAPGSAAPPATSPLSSSNVTSPASPETFLRSMSHDQFAFPLKPASTGSGDVHEDAVLLDDPSEGGSTADGWTEVDA